MTVPDLDETTARFNQLIQRDIEKRTADAAADRFEYSREFEAQMIEDAKQETENQQDAALRLLDEFRKESGLAADARVSYDDLRPWLELRQLRIGAAAQALASGVPLTYAEARLICDEMVVGGGEVWLFRNGRNIWRGGKIWERVDKAFDDLRALACPNADKCEDARKICEADSIAVDSSGRVTGFAPSIAPLWALYWINRRIGFYDKAQIKPQTVSYGKKQPPQLSALQRAWIEAEKSNLKPMHGRTIKDDELLEVVSEQHWQISDLVWELEALGYSSEDSAGRVSGLRASVIIRSALMRGILEFVYSQAKHHAASAKDGDPFWELKNFRHGGAHWDYQFVRAAYKHDTPSWARPNNPLTLPPAP